MKTAIVFRERLLTTSETFILEQARSLRNYRPVLAGLRRTGVALGCELPQILLRNGSDALDKIAARLFYHLATAPKFIRNLRAESPSIVHAHFATDAVQAMPIAKALDVPLIVSLHGHDVTATDAHFQKEFLGRHFLRHRKQLFDFASGFICVSASIRDAALRAGFPERKLHIHYTGIDCERFRAGDGGRDPQLILFVGRLVEKKGCEYLLRAMVVVQRHHPEARVEIIGDGPLRSRLESIAASLGVRASFRGMQNPAEVLRSMSRARILCNPSVTAASGDMEGFGMVFAEAQAVGTPVVSFFHGAIPEAVSHGTTGLLSPERKVCPLANSLCVLLEDDRLWSDMSWNARRWVEERFDIARQTKSLEALYDECVENHQPCGSPLKKLGMRVSGRQSVLHACGPRQARMG
jgi:colanic acid/amylovoran biosynthesis glycosyltransferase